MSKRLYRLAVGCLAAASLAGCIFVNVSRQSQPPETRATSEAPRPMSRATLTALMLAAHKGENGKIQELVRGGEKPDARGPHGWTALHYAAAGGHQATASALIEAGADATLRNDDGQTPAQVASQFQNEGTAADLKLAEGRRTQD